MGGNSVDTAAVVVVVVLVVAVMDRGRVCRLWREILAPYPLRHHRGTSDCIEEGAGAVLGV